MSDASAKQHPPNRRTRRREIGLTLAAQDALGEAALRLKGGDSMGALRGARLVERLMGLDARLSQRWRLDRELRERFHGVAAKLMAEATALDARQAALEKREARLAREAAELKETRAFIERCYAQMYAQGSDEAPEGNFEPDPAAESGPEPAPEGSVPALPFAAPSAKSAPSFSDL